MRASPHLAGWNRTDMVLLLALLLILATSMIPALGTRRAAARDALRLEDMQRVRAALERYRADHGTWPAAHESEDCGGWDVSHDGDFIPALVAGGYLDARVADPVDDEEFQYRYRVYEPGSFGCACSEPYFVLGIRSFESELFGGATRQGFRCAKRDWGQEFAWVVGSPAAAD